MKPATLRKRDGQVVGFVPTPIAGAIRRAMEAAGDADADCAGELAMVVVDHLTHTCDGDCVDIEEVQDAVIHILLETGHYDTALAFVRYREDRERFRRSARTRDAASAGVAPNLHVVEPNGRRRLWDRAWIGELLAVRCGLDDKALAEVLPLVEDSLAGSLVTEIATPLLFSLVDAALVRSGRHALAAERSPLRLDRAQVRELISRGGDGRNSLERIGRLASEQLALSEGYPEAVVRLACRGRLWIDGLDDHRRGSQLTATVDGITNPWQVLASAMALAADAQRRWRRIRLVLPPSILGHLERGAQALVPAISGLARMAQVHLYCDGRTPLLSAWPFAGEKVGLATYHDDFLLLRRLHDMGLPYLSGPHLMSGAHRRRVAVDLALNAQGLEGEHAQMDALAMALVAACRRRLDQLLCEGERDFDGADLRFALFGLPIDSPSGQYLERQVIQEGARHGITLARTAHLHEEACAHLGRLLE